MIFLIMIYSLILKLNYSITLISIIFINNEIDIQIAGIDTSNVPVIHLLNLY